MPVVTGVPGTQDDIEGCRFEDVKVLTVDGLYILVTDHDWFLSLDVMVRCGDGPAEKSKK